MPSTMSVDLARFLRVGHEEVRTRHMAQRGNWPQGAPAVLGIRALPWEQAPNEAEGRAVWGARGKAWGTWR